MQIVLRSLLKEVRVGLSVQSIDDDLVEDLRVQGGDVSSIVTVEPRRRKFHKAVTVTMPLPPKYRHTPKLYKPETHSAHINNTNDKKCKSTKAQKMKFLQR